MRWYNYPSMGLVREMEYEGFVYRITNQLTNQYYIGKKSFWTSARKKLVRKPTKVEKTRLAKYKLTNKAKYTSYKKTLKDKYQGLKTVHCGRKESNWKTYTGSSKELNDDIKKLGIGNFFFEILKLCKSKSELSYQELLTQIKCDVLNDNKAYNKWISVKLYRTK